ncbi:phosphoenolpyruvate synthase [Sulfurihydrogenibium azorense Az-Fu1]|uniref:Phosphoenolpyruvate synthase n=1 Tax=Sulfurihydrogenibium azorense (strain DSM 15241 / OCM 825 / Az-Fu1) TaxID=204536 RepID=C1DU70_SULAA|nr:phosphoenolpyruvate synthase [Sulfurihydrogenibium azorense]ACN99116.1 phosphoenolpyruvate synthase [Sulfurihydrogenibium azorense Az-Fu1]
MKKLVMWLNEVGMEDIELVGGKNASLGEMIKGLSSIGIKVPMGFVVTSAAYWYFVDYNNLRDKIKEILTGLDPNNIEDLSKRGLTIRELIKGGTFPEDLKNEILKAYEDLSKMYNQFRVDVAVRSSATAEDLPNASFAGQQDTYLNIKGDETLLSAIKSCFASLFTDRAISYREAFKFDHFAIGLAVGVQKMVRSDLASSGVSFSIDSDSGFKDVVLINASYGLGEMVVQGAVTPDEFLVFKPTLKEGYEAIIEKKLGRKTHKMVYGTTPDERTKIVAVSKEEQMKFSLTDEEVLKLARWVMAIEEYYSNKYGKWTPMDVEWAKDGELNELFIVQARPETVHSQKDHSKIITYKITEPYESRINKRIVEGIAVGDKVAFGKVRILHDLEDAKDFQPGEVLVTDMTDPDWEPIMKKAAAIVTNKGGRTCHAAIVARELGVPAVVGTGNATEVLENGDEVTVSCAEGERGYVYRGKIEYEVEEFDLRNLPKTKTPIMMNVASPEGAFDLTFLPNAGVGLAREEFIINNYISIHPLALIKFDEIKQKDPQLAEKIEDLTFGYENKEEYYVKKLSYGIAKIAAAFYPKPVIVRFSDFKSNEYANLLGGKYFEPEEENPMIGFRGASRYYSDFFKPAFGLECKAILRVRNKMGLKNVIVMVPFCRTPEEAKKVLEVMEEYGLKKGENGLQVYVMCELPSNVILADQFAEYFDGFSIGSNDLTQLTLGLDRDSSLVAHLYDERNEAVKRMIAQVIKVAKEKGKKIGICGQGPSDYPEFAQFLVEQGIDTISINPDSIVKTTIAIYEIEQKLGK